MEIEIAAGCPITYVELFYHVDEADAMLAAFLAEALTPEIVRLYGRDTVTERRSAQYGADYFYNAKAKTSTEWTPLMLRVRERMEAVAGSLDGGLGPVVPRRRCWYRLARGQREARSDRVAESWGRPRVRLRRRAGEQVPRDMEEAPRAWFTVADSSGNPTKRSSTGCRGPSGSRARE